MSENQEAIVAVSGLVYEYDNHRALHGVDLKIARGSVCALVGPNGAGKTTLMKNIAALVEPYQGEVFVDGINTSEEPRRCHERLGFLPDFFGLYDDLTVAQCLTYAGLAHGVPNGMIQSRLTEVTAQLGLEELVDRKAEELSRGQRQRLAIGQTIMHRQTLLLLDEPASGLDPDARIQLSKLLLTLKDGGMTIVVSSHILAELEDYSSEVIIMSQGEVVDHHRVSAKGEEGEEADIEITLLESHDRLSEILDDNKLVSSFEIKGDNRILLTAVGGEVAQSDLLYGLVLQGIRITSFVPVKKTVKDIYISKMSELDKEGE